MPARASNFPHALGLLAAAALALAPVAGFAAADAEPSELVMAVSRKSVTLDPLHTFTAFESQLFTALYEGLLSADPVTLAPRPGIASSWTVSDDGKTYRFTLRPDTAFSNGDRVRAKDFVDSWMRMIDPAAKAEYSFLFDVIKGVHDWRTGRLDRREAARLPGGVGPGARGGAGAARGPLPGAADPHRLLAGASLPRRRARPLGRRAHPRVGRPVPPRVADRRRDGARGEPVLLGRPRRGASTGSACASTTTPRRPPRTTSRDGVHWATIGDFGLVTNPDQFEAFPMFSTSYFFFACDAAPWSDARVRRALALLVPWDEIRTEDLIFPTSRLVPQIDGYPEVKGIEERDAAQARSLLADAGFPAGRGLPKLVIEVFGDSSAADAARLMAETWRLELGLETEIRETDGDDYFAALRRRDFELAVSTWIGDYADPLTFLQLWTTGSNLNDAGFSDAAFDAAVEEAVGIREPAARYRKLADAEQALLASAAVLPLNHQAVAHLINLTRIEGWHANPLDLHPFKYLRFRVLRAPSDVALATP